MWFSILVRWHLHLSWRTKPTASPILVHRKYRKWGVFCQKQVSRLGTSNYISQKLWDVITCPCPWYLLLAQQSWNVYVSFMFWNKKFSISINTWHQVSQQLDHTNIFCYDMKKFHQHLGFQVLWHKAGHLWMHCSQMRIPLIQSLSNYPFSYWTGISHKN